MIRFGAVLLALLPGAVFADDMPVSSIMPPDSYGVLLSKTVEAPLVLDNKGGTRLILGPGGSITGPFVIYDSEGRELFKLSDGMTYPAALIHLPPGETR